MVVFVPRFHPNKSPKDGTNDGVAYDEVVAEAAVLSATAAPLSFGSIVSCVSSFSCSVSGVVVMVGVVCEGDDEEDERSFAPIVVASDGIAHHDDVDDGDVAAVVASSSDANTFVATQYARYPTSNAMMTYRRMRATLK